MYTIPSPFKTALSTALSRELRNKCGAAASLVVLSPQRPAPWDVGGLNGAVQELVFICKHVA